jgi:hypothetical protein
MDAGTQFAHAIHRTPRVGVRAQVPKRSPMHKPPFGGRPRRRSLPILLSTGMSAQASRRREA